MAITSRAHLISGLPRSGSTLLAGGTVGATWTVLKEAYYGEFSDRLLLVDYDLLTQHPARTMELIYKFIDEPAFDHDFNQVDYDVLDQPQIEQAAEHFGLTIKADERLHIRRRMAVQSKRPELVFHVDGQTKQSEISVDDRNYAWSNPGRIYQELIITKGTAAPMSEKGVEALL